MALPAPFFSLRPSLLHAFRGLSLSSTRSLATTASLRSSAPSDTQLLPKAPPPYPYGPALFYKQSNHGLYGAARIQFGNKISKGRNKGKTRRVWKLNVRHEKLYSKALDKELQIKVTHRVLRTIRKVGGLDEYLLGDKPARIKELGVFGWKLRWQVMQSQMIKDKFEEEAQELGLIPPKNLEEPAEEPAEEETIQPKKTTQSKKATQSKVSKAE
ncbi:39S ribosomal protein L24, mitochondrial [Onygenales sp. PD_40]|nr:39S ribosomal protein L24, mitochondrial [Onygenales sp. PD_40]KAK2789788.1 39S ribosomal protein L24, mitochondrial [Onygenales sp. PD_12]